MIIEPSPAPAHRAHTYRLLILFTLLLFNSFYACSDSIYKWTDEQGNVHYGDAPSAEYFSETLETTANTYSEVTQPKYRQQSFSETQRPVTLYATSWCGYCKKARQYFQRNHIKYIEHDIEKSQLARRQFDTLGGQGVPLIVMGDKKMSGFSALNFEQLYFSKP